MLNRIFKSVLLGVFSLIVCTITTSCNKEKETLGVIIVKYNNGNPVDKAIVRLHQDGAVSTGGEFVDPDLADTEETDQNGRAEFKYNLEAILNVDVVKYLGNDTLVGTDVIRLLKGQTITKVVQIN